MPINLSTPGIHHIALRSADFARSRKFYVEMLGFPVLLETENIFILGVGNFALAVRGPESATPAGDSFSPFRVGLDHLALAATDNAEIDRVAGLLKQNNVWTSGPSVDAVLGKYYLAFKDPDGIKIELYHA